LSASKLLLIMMGAVGSAADRSCSDLQEVAKGNTNASLTDRASAGISALGDKADESSQ
jgi:hypothetical protein